MTSMPYDPVPEGPEAATPHSRSHGRRMCVCTIVGALPLLALVAQQAEPKENWSTSLQSYMELAGSRGTVQENTSLDTALRCKRRSSCKPLDSVCWVDAQCCSARCAPGIYRCRPVSGSQVQSQHTLSALQHRAANSAQLASDQICAPVDQTKMRANAKHVRDQALENAPAEKLQQEASAELRNVNHWFHQGNFTYDGMGGIIKCICKTDHVYYCGLSFVRLTQCYSACSSVCSQTGGAYQICADLRGQAHVLNRYFKDFEVNRDVCPNDGVSGLRVSGLRSTQMPELAAAEEYARTQVLLHASEGKQVPKSTASSSVGNDSVSWKSQRERASNGSEHDVDEASNEAGLANTGNRTQDVSNTSNVTNASSAANVTKTNTSDGEHAFTPASGMVDATPPSFDHRKVANISENSTVAVASNSASIIAEVAI
eukprot:TRINITY_DN32870_c0_g1_i1.p1 TRINITY_DN32870_c0_g1~~TRINITY_DN32870_c0_g1_i1.p1  ORF type:complete len:429 (+),score=67.42 TRINITY_DN32870_c0_g1_i1:152-1438(+)